MRCHTKTNKPNITSIRPKELVLIHCSHKTRCSTQQAGMVSLVWAEEELAEHTAATWAVPLELMYNEEPTLKPWAA